MLASESPFQSFKSKRMLSFVNIICSSVSEPKALIKMSAFCHTQLQWKVMERFRDSIREMWSVCTKIALIEKKFQKRKFADMFCCFCVYIPTSKFGGNRINSLWILSLYRSLQCPLQPEKSWIEKTALSRRVIFTSGQNLKPPILCQYLIFFHDFSFTFVISFGSLLEPKNRNLKKIADLKVYGNLNIACSFLYNCRIEVAKVLKF